MCTVTFIPVKEGFYLTSNRDEKSYRKQAIPPSIHLIGKTKLLFPKDADAGGTWIALNENIQAAVLLNGAFEKHVPQPPYRESRGICFLEIMSSDNPLSKFNSMSFAGIEPFTLILFQHLALYECRWDGNQKHCIQLKNQHPYIWSSATLYDDAIRKQREQCFAKWLKKTLHPSQQDILHFHRFTGNGDIYNDFIINRDGIVQTVSITGIYLNEETGTMNYIDLQNEKEHSEKLSFATTFSL